MQSDDLQTLLDEFRAKLRQQYGEALYREVEQCADEAGVTIEELLWRLEERGIREGVENN